MFIYTLFKRCSEEFFALFKTALLNGLLYNHKLQRYCSSSNLGNCKLYYKYYTIDLINDIAHNLVIGFPQST